MNTIFRTFIEAYGDILLKSHVKGRVNSYGVSLPETMEALGITGELTDADGPSVVGARVQEIVAGETVLAGIGAQIEDDIQEMKFDPILPQLCADLGVRLSALLAIGRLGIRTKVRAYRTEFEVQLVQRDGHDAYDTIKGSIALNDRVHWYEDGATHGITVAGGLSETMRLALVGGPLSRLLSHPRLDPLDLTILKSTDNAGARMATFEITSKATPVPLRTIRP